MKKVIISFILVITMFCSIAMPTMAYEITPVASQNDQIAEVIYFDDGSSLEISYPRVTESAYTTYSTAKTVTCDKDATYRDSDGNLEWIYTLTGTFSYTYGVSSTCTKASYTQTIYDDSWSFSDGSATRSGNKAIGKGTFTGKILFITFKTCNVDISLTCDKYGNVT